MFSIGEFSRISGMTIKTLRFYHEQELLVPALVDAQSGYRYYTQAQIQTAHAIAYLRGLDFSIAEIKQILKGDERVLPLMEQQRERLRQRIAQLRKSVRSLDQFIQSERQALAMSQANSQIEERSIQPILVAGIRMKGRYDDCGKVFARLGRSLGRFICGKPLLLHYDSEYHEDDADFEVCMPLKTPRTLDGVSTRQLPPARCVTLLHQGPYEQLGHSYAKVIQYINEKKYQIILPTREIYLKGPGMIFKGNPKNYLTEIQISVQA